MKLKLILVALFVTTAAFAEDAPAPTPAPTPEQAAPAPAQAPPQRFYLEVDQSDLAAISQALNELPKRVADPIILKLNGQLQAQAQIKAATDKALADATEKAKKRK